MEMEEGGQRSSRSKDFDGFSEENWIEFKMEWLMVVNCHG